jgi:hypothetical protein
MSPSGIDPRAAPVGMPVAGWAEEAPHKQLAGHPIAPIRLRLRRRPRQPHRPERRRAAACTPRALRAPRRVHPLPRRARARRQRGPRAVLPSRRPRAQLQLPRLLTTTTRSPRQMSAWRRRVSSVRIAPTAPARPTAQRALASFQRRVWLRRRGVRAGGEEASSAPRRTRSSGGISSFATPFSYAPAESEYILLPRTSPQNEGL